MVPVVIFKGHILASTMSCDGALAAAALGYKELSKTGHAIGIIILGRASGTLCRPSILNARTEHGMSRPLCQRLATILGMPFGHEEWEPSSCLQPLHRKQCSCHFWPLYSSFWDPDMRSSHRQSTGRRSHCSSKHYRAAHYPDK